MHEHKLAKTALRGAPSYIWREGQQRRLEMILKGAGDRIGGRLLDNGCGVGMYTEHLTPFAGQVIGLEYEFERAQQAHQTTIHILSAAGEQLPFPAESIDIILSHEVLEHVADDWAAIQEMVRVIRPGGRIILFCPNRAHLFETHGVYWRGKYHFGNIPLVNYLPRRWRDHLAPHVRVYSRGDLERLFTGLPVRRLEYRIIFGAYDNIIARFPHLGKLLRAFLQGLERTPLQIFGLSHFLVLEKT